MKLAFVYAGQGSQKVDMGRDFYDQYPEYRAVLDNAGLDFDLKTLTFEGPIEELSQTRYTQPCMAAFAVGVTDLLYARGIRPCAAAGLSLGEYSALHAAGVFDAATAIRLVAFRGKAMEEAAAGRESAMMAVLNLDRSPLQDACDAASDLGCVVIANYNCPGQLVIGGEKAAVDKAADLALAAGARRCLPLNVSGAFHTLLMHPAGDALREKFQSIHFAPMQFPVLFNCLGHEMAENDTVATLLEKQVQSGVRWEATVRRLAELGVDTAIEIGPGRVLTGFVKKTVGNAISCYPVETAAQLQQLLCTMKGA